MDLQKIYAEIEEFSSKTHGSSDYHLDTIYVKGNEGGKFAPLSYLKKKLEFFKDENQLIESGYIYNSFEMFGEEGFKTWFESQFSRKLNRKLAKGLSILVQPNNRAIFDVVEKVNHCYESFKKEKIILNGKNLPVQLGEWYAKCIFGLNQVKSSSQRGFDLYLAGERVEVKVEWSDSPSPKGVKIRKSLVELSKYCIIVYLGSNFVIREICFLDSSFVNRKFSGKGHTIFLKDQDIGQYFFSKSGKHKHTVANPKALMKYANSNFAMHLTDWFQ